MYPVHRGSKEFKRRQASFMEELDARLAAQQGLSLFGPVPPQLYELLNAGLQELGFDWNRSVDELLAVLHHHVAHTVIDMWFKYGALPPECSG